MQSLNNKKQIFLYIIIISIFVGIFTHAYMLTNKFINHDDVKDLFGHLNNVESGRWFLFFPSYIENPLISSPWLSGMLSIFYLAFASYFIVLIFEIKSYIGIAIIPMCLITWPSLTATLMYTRFASPYCFALMLMCFSAYLFTNKSWGLIASIVLIVLSLGIYQAYLGFFISISMLHILKININQSSKLKDVLSYIIKLVFTVLSAVIIYILISRRLISSIESSSSYQGINQMGNINLKNIAEGIKQSYMEFYNSFIANGLNLFDSYFSIISIIQAVIYIVFSALIIKANLKSISKTVVSCFILLLMPVFIGTVYFMNIEWVHILIKYFMVLYLIIPVMLYQLLQNEKLSFINIISGFLKHAYYILVAILIIFSYSNAKLANSAYMALDIAHKQGASYTDRLLTRIESFKDYNSYDSIILFGESSLGIEMQSFFLNPQLKSIIISEHSIANMHSYPEYIHAMHGFTNPIYKINSLSEFQNYNELNYTSFDNAEDILLNLNSYPSDNCMYRYKEGIILVKLSNEY